MQLDGFGRDVVDQRASAAPALLEPILELVDEQSLSRHVVWPSATYWPSQCHQSGGGGAPRQRKLHSVDQQGLVAARAKAREAAATAARRCALLFIC